MLATLKRDPPAKRIFVVDDHPMVRRGLAAQLANDATMVICGEAEDVVEALTLVHNADPDLVIVDISLKTGNGIDLVKRLVAKTPSLPILVWSMYPEHHYAERALNAGARGYINKCQSASQVMEAIRAVLAGRTYVSTEMSEKLLSRVVRGESEPQQEVGAQKLTDRELEAFELLGQGLTTFQIAERMHVSPKTVETYRARIKHKLGLTNAVELIQHAVQWVLEKPASV